MNKLLASRPNGSVFRQAQKSFFASSQDFFLCSVKHIYSWFTLERDSHSSSFLSILLHVCLIYGSCLGNGRIRSHMTLESDKFVQACPSSYIMQLRTDVSDSFFKKPKIDSPILSSTFGTQEALKSVMTKQWSSRHFRNATTWPCRRGTRSFATVAKNLF